MTAQTSTLPRRRSATDFGLPESFRARLDDLRDAPAGRSDLFWSPSSSPTPYESAFELATAVTRHQGEDSVVFPHTGRTSPRVERFALEQEFQGMVVSVDPVGDAFVARLADTMTESPEEEAEIAFEEISPDDRSLIVPGAVFTWTIGLVTESGGQVKRTSEIRFRRFFRFSPRAFADTEEKAERMWELLNDGDGR